MHCLIPILSCIRLSRCPISPTDRLVFHLHSDELGLVVSAAPELYGGEPLPVAEGEPEDEDGPPFILREHKLGVAFWCIPALFGYAQQVFKAARLVLNSTFDMAITPELATTILQSTRTILCVNADHYTAWNARKRLIKLGRSELQYVGPLLCLLPHFYES
jgi:hypothetical protein